MASAPKTQPTDASVDEFLAAATPARRREDGLRLAAIFREVTGTEPVMWGPSIVGYGTYHYVSPANPRTRGDWPKTGFSPRKAQLSLYGLKDLPAGAALLPTLGTYTEGAGCVYVRTLDDIDLDVLRRLIAIAFSRGDDPLPGTTGDANRGNTHDADRGGADQKPAKATDDALPRIGAPATRALAAIGVTTAGGCAAYTEQELLALHGVGPRAIRLLREAGVTLRGD